MINHFGYKRIACVCFTGHRPQKINVSEDIARSLLDRAVKQAVAKGYNTFITGMACGVDMWAAEIVLKYRRHNSNIRLVCAVPFQGFEKRRNIVERKAYHNILRRADYIQYVCDKYSPKCFQLRNEWMVDHSSKVIAVFNGLSGGTKNTINYAEKIGVPVENCLKSDRYTLKSEKCK